MFGYANSIPATNLFAPRWTPYLGQVIAPKIFPAPVPAPAPSQAELPYPLMVAFRSLDFGLGAIVGGAVSLGFKAVFPGLRWTKQQGMMRMLVGAGVGILGSLIPVGGAFNIVPLVGGYMVGSGAADQILPRKKARRA